MISTLIFFFRAFLSLPCLIFIYIFAFMFMVIAPKDFSDQTAKSFIKKMKEI